MKKFLSFWLAAFMALSMAACAAPADDPETASEPTAAPATAEPTAAPAEESLYIPGTYTAEATGMGKVTVTITVDADSIIDVALDLSAETPSIGQAAEADLISRVMAAQSAEFDAVAGATITTDAVKVALSSALAQAAEAEEAVKTPVQDGTYTATASSFSVTGMMTCDVTFKDGAIADIIVVEETDSQTGKTLTAIPEIYIPRLIEAQSLTVDAVTGATYSSNAVRSCVAQAIELAGGDSTQWYTPVEKAADAVVLEGYDVIVVGLGGSGILSYCSAAHEGASVFGIEQAALVGGNSVNTAGPMAINSEYLKETANNGEDYIDAGEVYDVWMEYVGDKGKADIIKIAIDESGEALDFYIENFGIQVSGLKGSFVKPEWTALWTYYVGDTVVERRVNTANAYQAALDKAAALNEKSGYSTELTATELITDASGSVTGVRAISYDGSMYEVYGDSVILATGGFVGNEEMMERYLGSSVNVFGTTINNGAGIQMAQAVGGALFNIDVPAMIHITQVPNIIRNDDLDSTQKAILTALCLSSDQLAVTVNGELWGNPKPDITYAPGYQYYVVYTQEEIDAIRIEGLRESYAKTVAAVPRMGQGGTFEVGVPVADIDTILEVGMKYGNVIKASSIAELAAATGCNEAALSESLGGRETTYYAVIAAAYSYATVGGLDVDANMNVLREDGSVIENLYAVGQDSEGVCNASGKAYTPWAGQAQSWTFVSGRIAGQNAAAYGATK